MYAHKQHSQKYTFKEAGTSSECTPLARMKDNSNADFRKKTYFLRSMSTVNSRVYHFFRLRVRERGDGGRKHFYSSNTLHDVPTRIRCGRRDAHRDTVRNTFSHAFMCLRDTRPACAPRQLRESDWGDWAARRAERFEKGKKNRRKGTGFEV